MRFLYLLSCWSFISSCSPKECTSYIGHLNYDTILSFSQPVLTLDKVHRFGIHLYTDKDSNYLLTMDREKNIVLQSLSNSTKLTLSSLDFHQTGQLLPSRLVHDSLFVMDFDSNNLYLFRVTPGKLVRLKKIHYGEVFDNWSESGFDTQHYEPFEVFNNTGYFPYRINVSGTNFTDTTTHIGIPLLDSVVNRNKIQRWLPAPTEYRKETVRNPHIFLKKMDDSICLEGFGFVDTLHLYNYHTGLPVKKISFNKCSQFRKFKPKQVYDLAYVRWHDATTEENTKILVNKNRILLIKRLRRNEITDTAKYEYYYFDKDLNLLKHNLFEHSIREEHCFVYKDGFLLFDNKLMKAYYYGTQ